MASIKRNKILQRRWRTLNFSMSNSILFLFILYVMCVQNKCNCETTLSQQYITTPLIIVEEKTPTEIPGGLIINQRMKLEKSSSPYLVREDIIIDKSSELTIDPGVEIRFSPMVGITIRGILTAKVNLMLYKIIYVHKKY